MLLVFARILGTPADTQAQPQVLEQLWTRDSLSVLGSSFVIRVTCYTAILHTRMFSECLLCCVKALGKVFSKLLYP